MMISYRSMSVISAFIMCFSFCRIFSSEYPLPYKEMLYCDKRQALYDQSALVHSPKFLSASREQQEKMMTEHLHVLKNWGMLSLVGKAIMTIAFYGGVPATILYKLLKDRVAFGAAMGISMAVQPFTSILGEFYKKVDAQGTFLATMFMEEIVGYVSFVKKPLLPAEKLELAYIKRKPFLDTKVAQLIEDSLISFFCKSAWLDGSQRSGITSVDGIRTALALPTEVKKVVYDEAAIEKVLASYADDIKDALRLFCVRHIASGQSTSPRKAPIYFYGPHGVGKTYAVKLIANVLQLPCATIQLRGSLDALIGDAEHPGQLLEALITATYEGKGAKNMILFVDEADKIVNFDEKNYGATELQSIRSFLLHLFDAETKTFYSPYLRMDVDIAHIGIILAGNAPIQYAPMANRFRLVAFPPFTVEQKLNVFKTSLLDKALIPYEPSHGSVFTITKFDITDEDYEVFRAMIANDKDEGLRSLQAKLEDYLANMASCKAAHKDNRSWSRILLDWISWYHANKTEEAYRSCIRLLNKVHAQHNTSAIPAPQQQTVDLVAPVSSAMTEEDAKNTLALLAHMLAMKNETVSDFAAAQ